MPTAGLQCVAKGFPVRPARVTSPQGRSLEIQTHPSQTSLMMDARGLFWNRERERERAHSVVMFPWPEEPARHYAPTLHHSAAWLCNCQPQLLPGLSPVAGHWLQATQQPLSQCLRVAASSQPTPALPGRGRASTCERGAGEQLPTSSLGSCTAPSLWPKHLPGKQATAGWAGRLDRRSQLGSHLPPPCPALPPPPPIL